MPATAKPSIQLQLSSPIEEGIIDSVYDPLNSDSSAAEGSSTVIFRGVEPSTATLTVSAKDADIPLGSSSPHDVAPLCALDPMDIKDKYVTELPVAIVAEDSVTTTNASVSATVEEDTRASEADATEEAVAVLPTCTVTLRITYKPSPKDQREELYELLNKTSQHKATALDNLRKVSTQAAASRSAGGQDAPSGSAGTVTKPSVKPGFLNKQREVKESKMKKLYDRTLGPNSPLRAGAFVAFGLKDFFIFFGSVAFFHFKGQLLAIPPPV